MALGRRAKNRYRIIEKIMGKEDRFVPKYAVDNN